MIEYKTKYDVRTTMFQQFEKSAAERGENPCLYYYNSVLNWKQTAELRGGACCERSAKGRQSCYLPS